MLCFLHLYNYFCVICVFLLHNDGSIDEQNVDYCLYTLSHENKHSTYFGKFLNNNKNLAKLGDGQTETQLLWSETKNKTRRKKTREK
jgi:hypothetical protein